MAWLRGCGTAVVVEVVLVVEVDIMEVEELHSQDQVLEDQVSSPVIQVVMQLMNPPLKTTLSTPENQTTTQVLSFITHKQSVATKRCHHQHPLQQLVTKEMDLLASHYLYHFISHANAILVLSLISYIFVY